MPLERVSKGFKDISLSFKRNPLTDDIITISNESAIARSIRNIVYTQYGEKFFNPRFGCDIQNTLFENLDEITSSVIRDKIRTSIINYEPRVRLIRVDVSPNYDGNEFNVTIVFEIIGIDINSQVQRLEFVLQPTR